MSFAADGRPFDVAAWPRRAAYEFFRDYDHPWFQLCAPVEVGPLLAWSRAERERRFFLGLLWLVLKAIDELEPFRLRLRADGVVVHDAVGAGATVARDDGTFAFADFPWRARAADFFAEGVREIARARVSSGLEPGEGDACVHCTSLPWLAFTGVQHPRRHDPLDSVPKIVFGRRVEHDAGARLPVAVDVHHALLDGREVCQWFARLEELAAEPEKWLR